jgi:hypothetical protein
VAYHTVDARIVCAWILVIDGQGGALAELLREVAHGADIAVCARVIVVARDPLNEGDLDAAGFTVAAPGPAGTLVVLSVTDVHLTGRHALARAVTAVERTDVLIEVARDPLGHGDHDRALSGRRVAAKL